MLCFVGINAAQQNTDSTVWIDGAEYKYDDLVSMSKDGPSDSALALTKKMMAGIENGSLQDRINAHSVRGSVLFHAHIFQESVEQNRIALRLKGDEIDAQTLKLKNQIAVGYRYQSKLDSAAMALEFILEHQELLPDSFELGRTYYTLNSVYAMQARFDEALECLYKALDINEAIGELAHANIIKVYIGTALHDSGEHDRAFEYQQEAEDHFLKTGDDGKLLFVYMERGTEYQQMGKHEEAIADLTKGIEIAERIGHRGAVANLHELLGDVYIDLERYEEAETSLLICLNICEQLDIPYGVAGAHSRLSKVYLETDQLDKALEHALIQDELSAAHDLPRIAQIGKKRLASIYARLGNYEMAYVSKLAEYALKDSLDVEERATALDEIREKYESEKNLREVERLHNEAEVEELKRNGLIAGLGLLFVLSVIILNREVQRRKKARALLEAEIEVERLEKVNLEETLKFKNRELNSMALNIAQKNDLLEELKHDLKTMQRSEQGDVTDMVNKLRIAEQIEGNWDEFTRQFTETNPAFYKALTEKYSDLTKSDLRLAALLRMNLNSKDISRMLNISDEGVKKARYRLRKNLGLQTDDSLEGFILSL